MASAEPRYTWGNEGRTDVTKSNGPELLPQWAIEIERLDTDQPSEFYSVAALQIGKDELQIITPGGTQVSFKTNNVRKLLIMRVQDKTP